jgi:hypothetical protein
MKQIRLGVLISLGLVLLAAAITLRNLSADSAPLRLASADFVVTSAGDAGPQTLRDAILAADRLSSRAHILITAKHITIDSALPALINPSGIEIDASADSGTIDADHQATGAVLQVNSPASTLRGLRIINAHASGIIVNAPGARLDSVTITDSKLGIVLTAAARGSAIRTSTFERDETALMAEAGIHDLTVISSVFRDNTRAGVWSVAAAETAKAVRSEKPREPVQERVRIIDGTFEKNASAVVVANQPILVHKSRFIGNRESAVLILGGAARIEDNEIRDSGGTAISVTSGTDVHLARNTLTDNSKTAIMVRDSEVTIESNTLTHSGFGIVSIISQSSLIPVIRGNLITGTTADAITVIGGNPILQRNQIIDNHGAGLRALDLVQAHGGLKAAPSLDTNVFRGNGLDAPLHGVYTLTGAL